MRSRREEQHQAAAARSHVRGHYCLLHCCEPAFQKRVANGGRGKPALCLEVVLGTFDPLNFK